MNVVWKIYGMGPNQPQLGCHVNFDVARIRYFCERMSEQPGLIECRLDPADRYHFRVGKSDAFTHEQAKQSALRFLQQIAPSFADKKTSSSPPTKKRKSSDAPTPPDDTAPSDEAAPSDAAADLLSHPIFSSVFDFAYQPTVQCALNLAPPRVENTEQFAKDLVLVLLHQATVKNHASVHRVKQIVRVHRGGRFIRLKVDPPSILYPDLSCCCNRPQVARDWVRYLLERDRHLVASVSPLDGLTVGAVCVPHFAPLEAKKLEFDSVWRSHVVCAENKNCLACNPPSSSDESEDDESEDADEASSSSDQETPSSRDA